jgi:hypothetical protein
MLVFLLKNLQHLQNNSTQLFKKNAWNDYFKKDIHAQNCFTSSTMLL